MTGKSLSVMFLILILSMLSCSKSTEPNVELQYQLEIIPSSDILISWDQTYYQHDTTWVNKTFPDTLAADSLANILCNSNLPVTDLWFPQQAASCRMVFRSGSYVIVKLQKPETEIEILGFQSVNAFPMSCFGSWRHYKFEPK